MLPSVFRHHGTTNTGAMLTGTTLERTTFSRKWICVPGEHSGPDVNLFWDCDVFYELKH